MSGDPVEEGGASLTLLSHQERLRLLEANVTDYAIFMVDTDRRIACWNAGAQRILGYEEVEIIGQSIAVIYTPEDREQGEDENELRIARETGRAQDERWHIRKDASRFWASGILTALYDPNGRLRGYAKILRDFTAHKRYEERIEALNVRLQSAMIETHHRVKNNLQIISAMIDVQTLGRKEMVPVAEYKRLSNQVRALAAMHDVLTEDTKAGRDTSSISLSAILTKLIPLLRATSGKSCAIHSLPIAETATLSTRKGNSLCLIINELIANAIKHGGGNVWIAFEAPDGNARLTVCDDGPGFPAGFQAEDHASIGLQLIEDLTRMDLRGEVDYANRPEGGGCVTVLFRLDS